MGYQISALACACYATSCCLLFSFLACLHCRDSEQGCAWEEQTTSRIALRFLCALQAVRR
jgi:hypothetical protein